MKGFKIIHMNDRIEKDTLYKFGFFFFSFFYATFLSSLPIDAFVDRDNYLIYAQQSGYLLGLNYSSGLLRLIFNEPVWLLINFFLSFVLDPENVVRLIIFFSSFFVSYYALNYSKKNLILLLIILLLPQILKNHIIHLRQGLALSFFLIGWFSNSKYRRNILLIMSAFIHSSFFFVLAFIFIDKIVSTFKVDIYIKSIICFLAAIVLLLLMGVLASILGARQAEEIVVLGQTSGLGFLFWLVMMFLFLLQKEFVVAKQSFIILCIIVYLTTYFFTPYTARIFESTMLLILMAGTYFTKELKIIFIILVGIYFLGQWYPLLDLPKFGWGVENF
ncbi:EpsG family protein [Acinetobacter parvus]|uniref:EpsG family protein n=1 Tax=Acinetobacter parvus TaxID=134533 RepID=UPI0039188458